MILMISCPSQPYVLLLVLPMMTTTPLCLYMRYGHLLITCYENIASEIPPGPWFFATCYHIFFFSGREFALSSATDVLNVADEAQKAETDQVFDKIWFMIVGDLEYSSWNWLFSLFFLDLSMVDRGCRLHDDLYRHSKAQRFDLHRSCIYADSLRSYLSAPHTHIHRCIGGWIIPYIHASTRPRPSRGRSARWRRPCTCQPYTREV
jgi:hypothetical protein